MVNMSMTDHQLAPDHAQLIGVDWGSTGFRAFLFGQNGAVLETRTAAAGASQMTDAQAFASTLHHYTADWQQNHALPVIACGMVGSRHGWQEVPYALCAAHSAQLGAALGQIRNTNVYLVPGLITAATDLPPDVMRGEETQIVGALHAVAQARAASCIVLPGTHSKWVQIADEKIIDFATHMTGELFAVLRNHSVLGRLLPLEAQPFEPTAFLAGVGAAQRDGQLGVMHQLFAVRTLGLTEKLSAQGLADYLSGLLIGHEIRAGLVWRNAAGLDGTPLVLVGEPALCQRYRHAMTCFDLPVDTILDNTAATGLWHLARAAQLI